MRLSTSRSYILGLLLLLLVGLFQVASTHSAVGLTYDEPFHIAAGLEIWQFGAYTYEPLHPPLGRIAVAAGPYLAGARLPEQRDTQKGGINLVYADGNQALASGRGYARNLSLARWGTLASFLLLCVMVFLWARRWFTPAAGLWAVALAVCLPPLLGHAGVAALDVAGATGLLAALFAYLCWLERPVTSRAVWLGLAAGFAVMMKFSNLAFLAASVPLALFSPQVRRIGWRAGLRGVVIAGVAWFVFSWTCYGFTLRPLGPQWGPHPTIDKLLAERPTVRAGLDAFMAVPLPLTEVILGVRDVGRFNALGHDGYLLGEYRRFGWWYFFPVVLAVKTPIAILLLAFTGVFWGVRGRTWPQMLTTLFAAAILAVSMRSHINAGIRHILAIYPFLLLLAGSAVDRALRLRWAAPLALGLVAWSAVDAVRAHPDYLAWTNPLAGSQPEHVLAESDLDWGQDLDRLAARLRELHAPSVAIAYFGSAPLEHAGLPEYRPLDPRTPTSGWVAISVHHLYLQHAKDGSFGWLKRHTRVERVGKSIHLFYIPE